MDSWRGAERIRENEASLRHLGLAEHAIGWGDATAGESFKDCSAGDGAFVHRSTEQFGGAFSRDIVGGWAKATGDEDDIGAQERFFQCAADVRSIWHRDLARDAYSNGEEGFGEKGEVGVGDMSEQEFGACVDEFGSHGKW
jgi:hypothetical protein